MTTIPASRGVQKKLLAVLSGVTVLALATLLQSAGAVKFEEPNRELPVGTVGGGSRSGGRDAISPLLPSSGFGTTQQARPTFWIYTSSPLAADTVATFYLRDSLGGAQYEAVVPLSHQAGIVSFSLPEELQDLEVARPYHWFLVLGRAGDSRQPGVGTPFARGTIERVAGATGAADSLEISLAAAIAASQEGRWYDAVTILATLRRDGPNDLEVGARWKEFLQSAQLDWLADSPFATQSPHGEPSHRVSLGN